MRKYLLFILSVFTVLSVGAQRIEKLSFGDFEHWQTRHIKESAIIGGGWKTCYEIAPTATVEGPIPYEPTGGSPWATSNVMAKVVGIVKVSNTVYPAERQGGGKCVKLMTSIEECRALGIVDIRVIVAGSIFTGRMFEPIRNTSNPYSKMEMGIPFSKRPKALVFDYSLTMPSDRQLYYLNGIGKPKPIEGTDNAEVIILLQRRVEDADGNMKAYRIGTGHEYFNKATKGWVNGYKLDVHYGDITKEAFYKPFMGLHNGEASRYARNSKGENVPVPEVGWDSPDATPTHILIMFSSGSGRPYTGVPGTTFLIDNAALEY